MNTTDPPPDDPDDRFEEILALYQEAWDAGLDAPADSPPDAAAFAQRLDEQRAFWRQVRSLQPPFWPAADHLPRSIGRFLIRRLLGHGGFGVVYLARDPRLNRDVALKVPRLEVLVTPELRQRFLREAEAAARLDHPNIVPVLEAGEAGALCYLATGYVPGPTLAQWLAGRKEPVPINTAVELVAALADGLHHAHARGVLHCDVKPGNVLLVSGGVVSGEWSGTHVAHKSYESYKSHDDSPLTTHHSPRLTDFGLARLADADGTLTLTGQLLGTPYYMAPEQAAGRRAEVSDRTDVWALGVVLFELLTGRPPFDGTTPEVLHAIQFAEAPDVRSLRREAPKGLAAVCGKCLEKDPARRYASAGELADDLRRVLRGEPPLARPPGPLRRVGRWCIRHQARLTALGGAALVALSLAAVLWPRPAPPGLPEPDPPAVPDTEYVAFMRRAYDEFTRAEPERLPWYLLADAAKPRGGHDPRGFEWFYLWRQTGRNRDVRDLRARPGQATGALAVQVAADRKSIMGMCRDHHLRRWDAETGELLDALLLPINYKEFQATFASGGRYVVTEERSGRVIRLWEIGPVRLTPVDTGGPLAGQVWGVSADGRRLAFLPRGPDGNIAADEVLLWEAATRKARLVWRGEHCHGCQLAPDGRRLAVMHRQTREGKQHFFVTVHDLDAAAPTPTHVVEVPNALDGGGQFSPDGRLLVAGDERSWLYRIFLAGEPTALPTLALPSTVDQFAFAPDGRTFAAAAGKHVGKGRVVFTLGTFDTESGRTIRAGPVGFSFHGMTYTPDGRGLVLGSGGGVRYVAVDEITDSDILRPRRATETWGVAYSPDGKRLAAVGEPHWLQLRDAASGKELAAPVRLDALISCVAWSPAGEFLVTGSYEISADGGPNNNVRLWDRDGAPRRTLAGHAREVRCVAVSPDGRTVASGGKDRAVRLWNADSGDTLGQFTDLPDTVNEIFFLNDGRTLIAITDDGTTHLFDWRKRAVLDTYREAASLWCAAPAPDGRSFTTGARDGHVHSWRAEKDQLVHVLSVDGPPGLRALAYSADGKTLALAGADNRVQFRQAVSGLGLFTLPPLPAKVNRLSFSPDGQRLAAALHDGSVRVWHAPKVESPSPFKP